MARGALASNLGIIGGKAKISRERQAWWLRRRGVSGGNGGSEGK
jgi:hypothetical protein